MRNKSGGLRMKIPSMYACGGYENGWMAGCKGNNWIGNDEVTNGVIAYE